jgi:hypothetical protein
MAKRRLNFDCAGPPERGSFPTMKRMVFFAGLIFAVTLSAATVKRTEDVIYGRKFGTALTLDVIEPANKNGAGVIFMVSGGFFSSKDAIN